MGTETYVFLDGKFITKSRDGELTPEYINHFGKKVLTHSVRSDSLPGGVKGMLSHADGKKYDSRSQYERAVKASGCVILGNDMNNHTFKRPPVKGEFNVRPQLREAVQKVLHRS